MISSQELGERLADARKRAGLTQAQLAEKLDLARTTIVAIEMGERRPTNAELVKAAEAVRVSVHDLLCEGAIRTLLDARFQTGIGNQDVPAATVHLGLPDRYVALVVSAYDQELLSESELAEMLATDVATARGVYQQGNPIALENGTQLRVDFTGSGPPERAR